jgi:hypothetical protein
MNKRILVTEEEKKVILTQHANKGTTLSENLNEFFFEDEEYTDEDNFGDYEGDEGAEETAEKLSNMEPTYVGKGLEDNKPGKMFGSFSDEHGWFDERDVHHKGDFDFDYDEEEFDEFEPFYEKFGDKTRWFAKGDEGKKFFDMYKNHHEGPFKVRTRREEDIMESEEEFPYEPGPAGMRSARSRADYQPAGSREVDLGSGVFGKYSEEIPPIVIRYMRKNPRRIIKRLYDIYGDKMEMYIEMAKKGE